MVVWFALNQQAEALACKLPIIIRGGHLVAQEKRQRKKEKEREKIQQSFAWEPDKQSNSQSVRQKTPQSEHTHTETENIQHSLNIFSLLFTHSFYLSWEVNGRPGAERWWRGGGGRGWNCCRCEASRSVRTIRSGACPDCRQLSPNCHWHRHNRARPRHQTWRASPTSAGHCRSPDCSCAGRTVASTVSSKRKRRGKESEEKMISKCQCLSVSVCVCRKVQKTVSELCSLSLSLSGKRFLVLQLKMCPVIVGNDGNGNHHYHHHRGKGPCKNRRWFSNKKLELETFTVDSTN